MGEGGRLTERGLVKFSEVAASILHKKKIERKVEKLPISNIKLGLGGQAADQKQIIASSA